MVMQKPYVSPVFYPLVRSLCVHLVVYQTSQFPPVAGGMLQKNRWKLKR